jgi:hypothetical protein
MRKILGTQLKSGDYQPCTPPQPRHFNSCDNEIVASSSWCNTSASAGAELVFLH